MDTIPEPFLPDQLDVSLAQFVELLSVFHLLRLLITRTQQVSNLDRTFDVLDKYPLVVSDKSVYLFQSVSIVDTRECNHELREYWQSMGRDALGREQM